MSVPSSLRVGMTGAQRPAISEKSWRLALEAGKAVSRGWLDEKGAFAAVVVDVATGDYNCRPEDVAMFSRWAVREAIGAWKFKRSLAYDRISYVVWPLAKAREPGPVILTAANRANRMYECPLTSAEVLAECRRIAAASLPRRRNARGR